SSPRIGTPRWYPKAGSRRRRRNLIMSNPNPPNQDTAVSTPANEPTESFKDIFSEYEQSHSRKQEAGTQGREGTVITVTADSIVLDIGFKTEGVLPLTA